MSFPWSPLAALDRSLSNLSSTPCCLQAHSGVMGLVIITQPNEQPVGCHLPEIGVKIGAVKAAASKFGSLASKREA